MFQPFAMDTKITPYWSVVGIDNSNVGTACSKIQPMLSVVAPTLADSQTKL